MYLLEKTENFDKKASIFKKEDVHNAKLLIKALKLLSLDPFYPSLKSHKVSSRIYGLRYSSRVSGDIRIIWDFDENKKLTLLLLDIGGHSGKSKVYN